MAAQYENLTAVTDAINGTQNHMSQVTKDALNDLLAQVDLAKNPAMYDVTSDELAGLATTASVIIMGENQGATQVFAANSPVQGLVLNGGESAVQFLTSQDVTVSIGGGTSDVTTGAGSDTISLQGGNATIDTGAGSDTVAITGGDAVITDGPNATGSGAAYDIGLKVIIDRGAQGNATIDAGNGFDLVQMDGTSGGHNFGYANGMFTMESDYEVKMTGVNVVTFGDAYADGTPGAMYESATMLAANPAQSMIGRLYQIALDRGDGGLDAASSEHGQLGGLQFWLDNAGACITQQLVYSFLNCPEFHNKYDNLSDQDYVETLFANMGLSANDTVGGMSVADYVMSIATNTTPFGGRYDVAWALATSDAADQFIGNDGQKYVIDAGDFSMDNPLA